MTEFIKTYWQAGVTVVMAILLIRERYFKVKKDGIVTKRETLAYQSDQIEELKDLIALKDTEAKAASEQNRARTEGLGREISTLQGQLLEKDKQAKEYLAILQNRDPKMEALFTQVSNALTDIHQFMQTYIKINTNK